MVVTQTAGTGHLPAETDEFVGRAAELRQVDELLCGAALITLTGPGGVGKTRIALRSAAAAADRYPDGAWFAELSGLRDPELLPHTIGRSLGLPEQAGGTASQRGALLAYLRDRRLLLVLDTCEHLVDACAALADAILAAAPGVTVLATSREPLAVAGETTFLVPPLPLTGPRGTGDAVELFARRAAAVAPGFHLTEASQLEVLRICQGLDGIPLSIELAAGRLRDLTVEQIASSLDRKLSLLTGGRDGGRAGYDEGGRHATARKAVAWSYETCTAAERSLWARLSVFPGAFDAAAAAEVCASGELSGPAILETIIALVDKSLLVRVDHEPDQPPAFRMLDTVREFGAERLTAAGDEAGIRDRFVARYLALARGAYELAAGDSQRELFARLRRDHAGVRAALEYALGTRPGWFGRERDGAELATRLWAYWMSSGLLAEALYWLGKALDRVTDECPQRAWLLVARCGIGAMGGTGGEAVTEGEAATQMAERLGQPLIAGRGYACLCLAYTFAGDLAAAARAGETAERLLAASGDTDGLILLDIHLSTMCSASGRPEQSIDYYHRGIARFGDASGERVYHGYLHLCGAFGYLEMPGREADCARLLIRLLLGQYDLDEVTGTAYGLELFGWLAARSGRPGRAAWLLGAAGTLWDRLGARLGNTASREQQHAATAAAVSDALGPQAYAALFAAGGRHPLPQVVALAINDADALDGPVPGAAQPGLGTLTEREREIAFLAAAGLSAAQVAGQLFLPPRAVDEHLASVFVKLGVTSAAQLGPWLGEPVPQPAAPLDDDA
jgi:predicted ATPase/DNA-binding CsgD family transcriptional regulator